MKQTLARIADNAAKGIFAVIHYYGVVTTQDLIDCGYGESMVFLKVKKLVQEGLILRVGRGVYRDATSNGLRLNSNGLEFVEPPTGCGSTATGCSLGLKSAKKVKVETPTGCGQTPTGCGSTATGCALGENPLTLVNDSSNKQEKKAAISSTDEIPAFISALSDAQREYLDKNLSILYKIVSPEIPNLSSDLIQRIAVAQFVFGVPIKLEDINEWRKNAKLAVEQKRVRFAYIAFSREVQRFYEGFGVQWTKCRPPDVVSYENKMSVLKDLLLKFPDGKEETAENFLTFKQCDDMERYVSGRQPEPAAGKPMTDAEKEAFSEQIRELQKRIGKRVKTP